MRKTSLPADAGQSPHRVAVVACDRYEQSAVDDAVRRGLGLLGGASGFVHEQGEPLLLKPNLLTAKPVDAAVTTHPTVFAAVARALREAGASLTYGDSPGFGKPESIARRAGLAEIAEELAIPFADFSTGREVSFADGTLMKKFVISNGVMDAAGIVSLPKMKTHGLTRMTGAIKNQFGCIPGALKGEFHARMDDIDRFSRMLVDLNLLLRPRLFVMDGIVAMEGNGPSNGTPRQMGVLLFSADPVALDATACRLMNLDTSLVATVTIGEEAGLGSASDVELVGDDIEPLIATDYNANRSPASTTGRSLTGHEGARKLMRRWVVPKPVIHAEACTYCGTCVKVCPVEPKAVDWTTEGGASDKRPPAHDYARCIRCYCCQELCPEGAIDVHVPPLGRLIHGS